LLKRREVRKVYWAIVGGQRSAVSGQLVTADRRPPNVDWTTLTHYLKKNEQQNKSYVYDLPGERRLKAELKYRKIASGDRYDLLEVELMTGRHHQIRAQLAEIGFPIKGDLKYGFPRSNPDGSISLHSRLIEFIHPVSKESIHIFADPPDDTIWNYFKNNNITI
jgi:23S rRNA pseudouridine1911/1915/1917 synthase